MKESEIKYPDLLKKFDLHPKLKSCRYDWSEMIKRHFVDGQSIAEIARKMSCYATTVGTVIFYAKIGLERKDKPRCLSCSSTYVDFKYQCAECGARHYSCDKCKVLFAVKVDKTK